MMVLGCPDCKRTFDHDPSPKGPWPPICLSCKQRSRFVGWAGSVKWEGEQQAAFRHPFRHLTAASILAPLVLLAAACSSSPSLTTPCQGGRIGGHACEVSGVMTWCTWNDLCPNGEECAGVPEPDGGLYEGTCETPRVL